MNWSDRHPLHPCPATGGNYRLDDHTTLMFLSTGRYCPSIANTNPIALIVKQQWQTQAQTSEGLIRELRH